MHKAWIKHIALLLICVFTLENINAGYEYSLSSVDCPLEQLDQKEIEELVSDEFDFSNSLEFTVICSSTPIKNLYHFSYNKSTFIPPEYTI